MSKANSKVCPKIVCIKGRTAKASIRPEGSFCSAEVVETCEILEFVNIVPQESTIDLFFRGLHKGRGLVKVRIGSVLHEIPCVVFEEKEFFLCMVISSNAHCGFDPENLLRGCDDEKYRNIIGHAFKRTCRTLEPIYHKLGVPITWLIDPVVAKDAKSKLEEWHALFGDDYGVMPTSYFHHNPLNYNINSTPEETLDFLRSSVEEVERNFDFYTEIIGIDQWVGGVGSNFVKAAEAMEMKGIWGIGYDHFTCDSSMFHRGAPWDMYKPDRENIKIPCRYASDLWAFQWTTRDLINTVHTPTGPSGSVMFSTDPDDIRINGIMDHQQDYYIRMLREYKANLQQNDFFVFLLHQEDHDTHHEKDNQYLEDFLRQVKEEVTVATLQEITSWLNLKYSPCEQPSQMLYLNDVLTCQDKVRFNGPVAQPQDWGIYQGKYPPHGAFYNSDYQIFYQHPHRKPYRVYNYKKAYAIKEVDSYPEEEYGDLQILGEVISKQEGGWVYTAILAADREYREYPLVVWDIPEELAVNVKDNKSVACTDRFMILFLRLEPGENHVYIKLE